MTAETNAHGLRIAIVGGGIGGLTLGLALRQRGMAAEVFEQAPELAEIGAAVALSANSTRELQRLGVLDAITAASTEPSQLIYRSWRDGRRIAAFPVHDDLAYQQRFGAPYYGIHRADLQRILSGALGGAGLNLGHRLVDLVDEGDGVRLEFANGRSAQADLVIGADGVRSLVRRYVSGGEDAVYSGTSAFRGIVPVDRLPSLPDPKAIQFWMGPDAHLLHYAIGGRGQDVNYFAVVEGPQTWSSGSWQAPIEPGEAAAAFKGWHPAVTEMVGAVEHVVRWGLFTVRPRCTGRGAGRALGRRRPRHAAAPRAGCEHDHRGCDHPGRAARRCGARRARCRARPLPGVAAGPHPQDPAQLAGDQRPSAPAGRPGAGGPRLAGVQVPRGFRLDPRVRRAALRAQGGPAGQPRRGRALAHVVNEVDPASSKRTCATLRG